VGNVQRVPVLVGKNEKDIEQDNRIGATTDSNEYRRSRLHREFVAHHSFDPLDKRSALVGNVRHVHQIAHNECAALFLSRLLFDARLFRCGGLCSGWRCGPYLLLWLL
jgi:hypothetical protein